MELTNGEHIIIKWWKNIEISDTIDNGYSGNDILYYNSAKIESERRENMLTLEKLTKSAHVCMRECDPNYWVICGPDVGSSECAPEVNMCAPDYGEDGCLPDCGPNE